MDIFELAALFTVLGSVWKIARSIWKHVGFHIKRTVVIILNVIIAFLVWTKHLLANNDDDSSASSIGVTGGVLRYF